MKKERFSGKNFELHTFLKVFLLNISKPEGLNRRYLLSIWTSIYCRFLFFNFFFSATTKENYLDRKEAFRNELYGFVNNHTSTTIDDSIAQRAGLLCHSMPNIELPKFSGSYSQSE